MDATSRPPSLAGLRRTYEGEPLLEADLASDPHRAVRRAGSRRRSPPACPSPTPWCWRPPPARRPPSARTVLLKGYDERGFVFYTNYESRKGRDLAENPRASLLFPWHPIRRQVRVEGSVSRLPHEESAAYFASRPYGSRIGAWASRQSAVVRSREELDARYEELAARWPEDPPVPDFWGGFRVGAGGGGVLAGAARPDARPAPLPANAGPAWALERLAP